MSIVQPSDDVIANAAERLRAGGVIAFPTETVYGFGADTFNEDAVAEVYRLKGRPFDNPLIAHVLDEREAKKLAGRWDDRCAKLAARFWPGPLTIIVQRADHVPELSTAGYATIALRCPAHVVARDLLAAFGGPISAPSANRSGHVSPTTAEHVAQDFADEDVLVIDGGPCEVGIESTVLDVSQPDRAVVLRPGAVTAEMVREVISGEVVVAAQQRQVASPGTSAAHYAPRTPAELVAGDELAARVAAMAERVVVLAHCGRVDEAHRVIALPNDAVRYAAQMYAALRHADAIGAARIVIERPEGTGELWDAVRDRLERATAQKHPPSLTEGK